MATSNDNDKTDGSRKSPAACWVVSCEYCVAVFNGDDIDFDRENVGKADDCTKWQCPDCGIINRSAL